MKQQLKQNMPYYMAVFLFFFILPYFILWLPEWNFFYEVLKDPELSIHKVFWGDMSMARFYMIFFWISLPLMGSLIALWHTLTEDRFDLPLILIAAVGVLSYLNKVWLEDIAFLMISVLLMVIIQAFSLLRKFERKPGEKQTLLSGIGENRRYLAIVFVCTVSMAVMQQLAEKSLSDVGQFTVRETYIFIWPWLLAALPFFQLLDRPLTLGGLVGIIVIFIVTIAISVSWYMNLRYYVHLGYLLTGIAFFLAIEGMFALVRYFKTKHT